MGKGKLLTAAEEWVEIALADQAVKAEQPGGMGRF